jgi:hypothetical protein
MSDLLDAAHVRDHRRGGERQLRRRATECLALRDGQQVGAESVDLGQQAGL